jgi:hypothetical protein
MLAFRRTKPAIFNGIGNIPLYPCATITDALTGTTIFSGGAAKFYRPYSPRIADITKNDFSYAHNPKKPYGAMQVFLG